MRYIKPALAGSRRDIEDKQYDVCNLNIPKIAWGSPLMKKREFGSAIDMMGWGEIVLIVIIYSGSAVESKSNSTN
ncbi:hypothetical protein NXW73_20750 [Bacteroides fragilis]|nr:hypothetical protein [Bacteroides fragilis]